MKIALIGIIKNEAHDILYWLAWHARLGVDSFILFDDDSSDGTRDLITAASLHWDIRLYHVREDSLDFAEQSHIPRQCRVYRDALLAAKNEFDWVGLLDADEYVSLKQHGTLHDFLSSMGEDIGAVALNWQLYGHNDHIARPDGPPFAKFTRHSHISSPINHHVKSFIRPGYWNPNHWVNVHYFTLSQGRYATASGQAIEWSSTLGIAKTPPEDTTAVILHFQNRSLEQFVERARNRRDITLTLPNQNLNDWNDQENPIPQSIVTDTLHRVRSVILTGIMTSLEKLSLAHPPPSNGMMPPSPLQAASRFTVSALKPEPTRKLVASHGFIQDEETSDTNTQLYLLQSTTTPEVGFLFTLTPSGDPDEFFIIDDLRLCGLPRYSVLPVLGEECVTLRQENYLGERKKFLCSPPDEALVANRQHANLWECFTLDPQPVTPSGHSWLSLPVFNLAEMALLSQPKMQSISHLAAIDRRATIWLLPVIAAHMDTQQKRELGSYLGPLAPFIL